MTSKTIYSKQEFLNPQSHYDNGAYSIGLSSNREKWTGNKVHYDGDIRIMDCSRSIALDMSFANKREQKQRLTKLRKLIKALQGLEDAIEGADL